MLAFRKLFLALALVTLTVAVASAQPAFQCVANAGVPPIVRSEGIAELAGDLVLNCRDGVPTAAGAAISQVNVQIFLNTNITSKLISTDNGSEAVLMIDEPQPAEQRLCAYVPGAPCTVLGNAAAPGTVYKGGAYNMWQGRWGGTSNPTTTAWLGVPIDPPGTVGQAPSGRIIRITNVRANATIFPTSSLVPSNIIMYISITGFTSVPINNPQQTVAWVQQGLKFSVLRYNDVTTSSARSLNQCASHNSDLATTSSVATVTTGCPSSRLRFEELFASSFKTRFANGANPAVPTDQNVPGNIYNMSESGYFTNINSGWGSLAGTAQNSVGAATQGTRFRAVIKGIPNNVFVYVTLNNHVSAAAGTAQLVAVAANGAGSYVAIQRLTNTASTCDLAPSQDIALVPVFGGEGTVVWEVTSTNALSLQIMDFGLVLAWKSAAPDLGTVSVNGSFAPVIRTDSSGNLTADSMASTILAVPRFMPNPNNLDAVKILICVSNLLFPFVTNQAGFNTGMVISNTSADAPPYGTTAESGTCSLYYFGNVAGGPAPPSQTSASVKSGDHMAWNLLDGGTHGILPTKDFQGYIIARCNFRWAHGYAFISDVSMARVANGYLALVLDQGQNTRFTNTGETLGN